MPKTLFKIDLTKSMDRQELPGHNRWHPDIPAVVSVNPGEVFRIECKDCWNIRMPTVVTG